MTVPPATPTPARTAPAPRRRRLWPFFVAIPVFAALHMGFALWFGLEAWGRRGEPKPEWFIRVAPYATFGESHPFLTSIAFGTLVGGGMVWGWRRLWAR